MEIDLVIVILVSAGVILFRRMVKRKNRIVPKHEIEMKDADPTIFESDGPFMSQ